MINMELGYQYADCFCNFPHNPGAASGIDLLSLEP
jgi:hypothetical protein